MQFFAWVEPGLFEHIIGKYKPVKEMNAENLNRKSAAAMKTSAMEER